MNAYLIARVSTEDQVDALPAQTQRLLGYAERHNLQYELIEFQESAYKGNRDEFKVILEKIVATNHLVAVVFDKIDRYTRDSSAEEVRIIQKLYKSGRIELHFVSDNLVIKQNSPATDLMRLGLGILLGQYYSDAISDNVKRRFEQKLRDGECIGKAPYGYINVVKPDGNKWVEISTYDAKVVRSIYEWYSSGVSSFRLVSKKIGEEYGLSIGQSKVELILKNPFYKGEMRIKGQLYPHNYDRIISEKLFEQSKSVRDGYNVKPAIYAGLPYPYRGLISCADCGCRITFEKKKSKYVYGHCTQTKGKHGAMYVPEAKFTEQLAAIVKSMAIPEHAYVEVSEALKKSADLDEQTRAQNLSLIEAEILKYDKRIERVYQDSIDDKIPEYWYNKKYAEFTEAKQVLKNSRKKFELMSKDGLSAINHLLRLSMNAPRLFENGRIEQKRALIKMIHTNLELVGAELRWKLKKPYDCMAFCNVSGNWLRGLDSNQRPSG